MNDETRRNESLLTIALFAAFADGAKDESEREEIRRLAESLSATGGPDLRALYQDVLLGRTTLEQATANLATAGEKHLAYEVAVGVCDADGRTSPAEREFLDRLKGLLGLPGGETQEIEQEAEQVVAMTEAAAPATSAGGLATAPAGPAPQDVDEAAIEQRIVRYSIINGALEVLPQSWASMAIIPLQIRLVYTIGQDYGVALDRGHIKEFLATLGVGMTSQYVEQIGRKLVGGLLGKMAGRGVGKLGRTATGAAFSFATTYALGHVARRYYAGGRQMSTQLLKQTFDEQFGSAKQLQAKYAPQISQRAQTLDMGEVLAMTRGSQQP
ncbi:MAG: YcjF family protein [Wenzhouxiangella sp.]